MRALIQRVSRASVAVDSKIVGSIDRGLLVLLGIGHADTGEDAELLSRKILRLRVFPDAAGKMNLSLLDIQGQLLVVSQFTLYAETNKGNRPSYTRAAPLQLAGDLYDSFIELCRARDVHVETGIFQAHMEVSLINDGPVTILCSVEHE